jgi:Flp pilus assembly protein TadD
MLDQAAVQFKKEVTITPDEPWAYDDLGTIYFDQGDLAKAGEMFRKALALDARMPPSLAGLGKTLLRQGQPTEALPYLSRAVENQPDNASYHFLLGQAYTKLGKRVEAEKQFADARKIQIAVVESQAPKLPDANAPLEVPAP